MPTIPADMRPLVASFGADDPGGVLRTDVAGGAPRYGLDFDRGTQRFRVSLILDALKLSVWIAFYFHVIKKGAITFQMDLDSGFGMQPHQVNIMPGSYSTTRTGEIFTLVSFVAEAESRVYDMSAADGQAFVDVYGVYGLDLPSFLNVLQGFANVDSNVLGFGL